MTFIKKYRILIVIVLLVVSLIASTKFEGETRWRYVTVNHNLQDIVYINTAGEPYGILVNDNDKYYIKTSYDYNVECTKEQYEYIKNLRPQRCRLIIHKGVFSKNFKLASLTPTR